MCYKQYRFQVISKKDENGRLNYNILGKPIEMNYTRSSI